MAKGVTRVFCGMVLCSSSLLVLQDAHALELGGYYKNLAITTETIIGVEEDYWWDINRLRLELSHAWESVSFDLQYDNEIQVGDYLDTPQFRSLVEDDDPRYWKWQGNTVDRNDVYGTHEIYRATLQLRAPWADIRLGRQQINWATALIWNPIDSFNPLNPLQLERDERRGVDAALLDINIGELSRLSVAHAPQHEHDNSQTAMRFKTNKGVFDWSLMAGKFADGDKIGVDFAGQLGLIGIRSEWVYTRPEQTGSYTEWVISADYSLYNGLTFLLEAFFNGDGHTDSARYDFPALLRGEKLGVGRHYIGGRVAKSLSARLDVDLSIITNLDDSSYYAYPSATWAIPGFNDLYLSGGAQLFFGSHGDEYSFFHHIFYGEVKLYF